ncbi:MAG: hypothetical protein ABIZ91_01545 [Gemmatimonadaceae bacterium]
MTDPGVLADRLAALPRIRELPRSELAWLAEHGEVHTLKAGTIVARKGERIEYRWIILDGHVAAQADRGGGPRRVADWYAGDVTGMLPYSRMKGPPGDNFVALDSELLAFKDDLFPQLVQHCPGLTALTVHQMIDRARSFNTSDLQDEKMVALGKLSAGLAHELNNPASAAVRGAKQLQGTLDDADCASRSLGAAGLSAQAIATIEEVRVMCLQQADGAVLSPIQQADREDEIAAWLDRPGVDSARAGVLADTSVTMTALDSLAEVSAGDTLDAALGWIAAGCSTHALARDIEQAATRIHDLVASVKRFTYMDAAAGPEPVDVRFGLRDTMRVLAAKARGKGVAVTLEAEADLPRAHAIGSELNQVWLNLLDNALDAVSGGPALSGTGACDRSRAHGPLSRYAPLRERGHHRRHRSVLAHRRTPHLTA